MPLNSAKMMIHAVTNKLTSAMGYIELATLEPTKRLEYLAKSTRELKEASALVKQLMSLIVGIAEDTAKSTGEAMEFINQIREHSTVTKTRKAADELHKKVDLVQKQLLDTVDSAIEKALAEGSPKRKKKPN